jgi:NADP-dependent 3-hydroxy acid dehydrogenase YdfG
MRELAGKAAFVTGAASSIGLAMATAFAREGMKVMLAAIEADALDKPVAALRATGADVHGVVCDVADPIRAEVEDRFAAILAAIDAFSDQ